MILAIDTSQITIGFLLCQCDTDNPHICRFACFGSIMLNNRESHFSQPKLKLYGLFHALYSLKAYLIRVRNLVVEVDERYIKGMLVNPDLTPSANINCWIISIHFTLVHIPSTQHSPDGLSQQPKQPADDDEEPPAKLVIKVPQADMSTSMHPTQSDQAVVKLMPLSHLTTPFNIIMDTQLLFLVFVVFRYFNPLVHSFLTLLHSHPPYLDGSFHVSLSHRLAELLHDKGITLRKGGATCGSAGTCSHPIPYIEIGCCT